MSISKDRITSAERLTHPTRRSFFAIPLAAFVPTLEASTDEIHFHHDHVMGTSLDAVICGVNRDTAERVEEALLSEIARLCKVLSTYDPDSEISRRDSCTNGDESCDLSSVLAAYQEWKHRTGGLLSAEIGATAALWRHAETSGRAPSVSAIKEAQQEAKLNVDALGKAYVMEQSLQVAKLAAPEMSGMLLNIGGDVLTFGTRAGARWALGVGDPANAHDNAPAAANLSVPNSKTAIATSGDYLRGYRIGETRYSHILDPRAGYPASGPSSATVIASDSITANALATSLCILSAAEGLALVERNPGTECLVIERSGTQWRSPGFSAYETSRKTAPRFVPTTADGWPAGYEVSIELTLKNVESSNGGGGFGGRGFGGRGGGRVRRPYVAVWAENSNQKLVRNIAVWANEVKYMRDLHNWWERNAAVGTNVYSMTRATRGPGKYQLVWDGLDDHGKPVTAGTYRIVVETNREHGNYASANGTLDCSTKPSSITLKETLEFEAVVIEFGARRQSA
jgi:thiamine biosynthesis lipoprotein ApbE